MNLKEKIRTVPHWPIEDVMFRDITSLLQDPEAFQYACDLLHQRYQNTGIDKIASIDARGFIFGAVLCYRLSIGFVPVRKEGKLPAKTVSRDYALEYGKNTLEIHADAINPGEKVLLVDDLLATGGTAAASIGLIEELGGIVVSCAFVIELPDLGGRELLKDYDVFAMVEFEGE